MAVARVNGIVHSSKIGELEIAQPYFVMMKGSDGQAWFEVRDERSGRGH